VIDGEQRVRRWNRLMEELSGIADDRALGKSLQQLPPPWPAAFGEVLADADSKVIKQSLGSDDSGGARWVILRSAATPQRGGRRAVLVEDISEYQRMQDELLHTERLASIGRLAAGVAHEIGNPITGIACVAQNLVDGADAAEVEQGTREILKQTERVARIVGSLMQLSHPGSGQRETECLPCNLADCIDEAVHLLALDREVSRDSFDNRSNRELLVRADNQLLLQVFINLLDNARGAADGYGTVLINARETGDRITVHVDNPGEPLAADVLTQVFEPFFTTKDVGEGTGLGLPLVRRMLEDMGGTITLQSPSPEHDGRGTRAEVVLLRGEYAPDYAA
jgi:PAS domain S-box-containing protein